MTVIQFWRYGEWTMVYQDGKLVRSGDHYLADEWLQTLAGVTVVNDEDGACIPDGRNAIASLGEVMTEVRRREVARDLAAKKRSEAKALLAEAELLESGEDLTTSPPVL